MLNIFVDVSKLPQTMDRYLGLTWGFSILVLPFIFVSSLTYELHKATEGQKPEYRKVIWSTILVVFSVFVYRLWFMKAVLLCEDLGKAVLNYQDWAAVMGVLLQKYEEVNMLNLFSLSVLDVVYSFSLVIAIIVEDIFEIIRYLFLCCLYVVGPVVLVSSIYPSLRYVFKRWCIFLLQVSFWIVIFRIFQSILLSFNSAEVLLNAEVVNIVVFSVTLILGCIFTPYFSAKLFEENNIKIFVSTVISGMNSVVKKIASVKIIPSEIKEKTKVFSTAKNIVVSTTSFIGKTVSKMVAYKTNEKEKQPEEKRIR